MTTLQEKLNAMKNNNVQQKPSILNKLNRSSSSSGGVGIRNKFQKREQSVLDKTYEERSERSKSIGVGKSIFTKEVMEQFKITEFDITILGDRFIEILPVSFSPVIPYFKEVPVHYKVGFAGDSFICLLRHFARPCYRCEQQQKYFRENPKTAGVALPDLIKGYYPTDRIIFLVWERTKELINNEPPVFNVQLWSSSKKKVHEEIQVKVRDKISKRTLDISDINPGGEGRTVSFTIEKQGQYPSYKGFDLNERISPIPDPILEQLDYILTEAQNAGFDNAIDMFLHTPTYEEIEKSMITEGQISDQTTVEPEDVGNTNMQSNNANNTVNGIDENELVAVLEAEQQKLMSMSPLAFKMHVNKHYPTLSGLPKEEAINTIIDLLYAEALEG